MTKGLNFAAPLKRDRASTTVAEPWCERAMAAKAWSKRQGLRAAYEAIRGYGD